MLNANTVGSPCPLQNAHLIAEFSFSSMAVRVCDQLFWWDLSIVQMNQTYL